MKKLLFLLCVLSNWPTFAYTPLFTGPLLAPSGTTVPKGHVNYEPYFYYTDNTGIYNRQHKVIHTPQTHIFIPAPLVQIGIASFIDFQIITPFNINWSRRQRGGGISDINAGFGFQIFRQKDSKYLPDLRIFVSETFPTGRYDKLNPAKLGTDATGLGTYQTGISFNFQYLQPIWDIYLRTRLSLAGNYASRVNIQGLSTYGGSRSTLGNISPGANYSVDVAFELSLTRNWVAVFEADYVELSGTNFRGNTGLTPISRFAIVGRPSEEQITLAPAIEYNFNEQLGIIAGAWLTVDGRNTTKFTSAVIAVNYYV
jgi:hypothetical protein